MNEEKSIRLDRMRYTKNTLASTLAVLAILFNVFYFISIYESNVGSWYYNILIGASILYNLVFMLAAFLSSEGIKNYKIGYSYAMIVLGVLQIVRHHPGAGRRRDGRQAVHLLPDLAARLCRLPAGRRRDRHDPQPSAPGLRRNARRQAGIRRATLWQN